MNPKESSSPHRTWLIAEDDPGIAALLLKYCSVLGITPLMFSDGSEVLDYLATPLKADDPIPDFALLDVFMPRVDGNEACRAIRKHQTLGNIPIMLMTAFKMSRSEKARVLAETGADGLLPKPLPPLRMLAEMIESAIVQHEEEHGAPHGSISLLRRAPIQFTGWQGVIAQYRPRLNLPVSAVPITLLEGNTPLVRVPRLAAAIAPRSHDFSLWLKVEGSNPTGSFKDRGMTVAITAAVHEGAKAVICASTGNTAASAAAYAARAGLRCVVIVPEGKIAQGKLAGALAYGAQVIAIRGSFDEGLALVQQASSTMPITLVNSINPYRIEGQKTAAFEIVDALGDAPDWLCLPVGNAGNITSYWRGFSEYDLSAEATQRPRLLGVQAAGAAPIVLGQIVEHPETVATAIRIGNPARWQEAVDAIRESDGHIMAVDDAAILEAWHMVAKIEGVFVEPASAAGIAGLQQRIAEGTFDPTGQRVVCVVTGHGLKDPDMVLADAEEPKPIPPTFDALAAALKLG